MNLSPTPQNGSGQSLFDAVNQLAASINHELISLADLAKEDSVSAVHLVRKRFKLYRAFIKLFKKCGPEGKLKSANQALRDLGKSFSELRDAHVRSETLRLLLTVLEMKPHSESIRMLLVHNDKSIRELETVLLDEQDLFARLENRILSDTTIHDYIQSLTPTLTCMRKGFLSTFKQCQTLYGMRQSDTDPDRLHEWRKRIKDLQYQYELTLHYLPPHLDPSNDQINALTDLLGHDQDLHNLKTWIHGLSSADRGDTNADEALVSHLNQLRKRLEPEIDRLGDLVFSIKPEEFENQLNIYQPI